MLLIVMQGNGKKSSNPAASRREAAPQTPEPIIRRARASDDPPNALVAAYDAGRLLNRLDWHLQQAWLLPAIDRQEARQQAKEVSDILSALARTLRPALRDELHDLTPPQEKIPVEERTRTMTTQETAKLMKFGGNKKGVATLRACIKAGIIKSEKINRDSHIFRKADFPEDLREELN